jgi:hypothetical protein
MSRRGHEFLVRWVDENILPGAYADDGDGSHAKQLAECCIADAQAAGISWKELGNIVNYMSQARTDQRGVARRIDGAS